MNCFDFSRQFVSVFFLDIGDALRTTQSKHAYHIFAFEGIAPFSPKNCFTIQVFWNIRAAFWR